MLATAVWPVNHWNRLQFNTTSWFGAEHNFLVLRSLTHGRIALRHTSLTDVSLFVYTYISHGH